MSADALIVRDILAVIHAYPLYPTSYATCGLSIEEPLLPEIILTLKKIPLAKYAKLGIEEVGLSIKDLILGHDSIFWRTMVLLLLQIV